MGWGVSVGLWGWGYDWGWGWVEVWVEVRVRVGTGLPPAHACCDVATHGNRYAPPDPSVNYKGTALPAFDRNMCSRMVSYPTPGSWACSQHLSGCCILYLPC